MSTAVHTLQADKRERFGTRASRAMRSEGQVPAVIAGDDKPHLDVSIDEHVFMASRRQHQHVYELKVGDASETAIVRHLDWDVFGERLLHIEFRRVDLTKKTEVEVELTFVGHAKGVVNHLATHLTIRALPTDIPDEIEVSVADLEVGASVLAGSLKMAKGVELVTSPELIVARISQLKVDLGPTPTAEAATAEAGTAAATPAAGAAPAADAKPEKGGEKKEGKK